MLYLRVVKPEGFALASVGTNVCKRRFLGALDFDGFAVKRQSVEIFRLVKDIDPNAFVSQSSVIGVYGEGFDKLKGK